MGQTLRIDTYTANATWTCPSDVTSVAVECWGAGGGGKTNTGAGGGGAYSKSNAITVTPDNNYNVVVGTSAVDTDGGDSTFNSTSTVAKGGLSCTNGGTGGASGSGTGNTKYSGGNGQIGTGSKTGGGGAGDSANGFGSSGGATNGKSAGYYSASPSAGGSSQAASQWAGGRGEVRITYFTAASNEFPFTVSRSWNRTSGTSHGITMPSGIQAGDLLILFFGVYQIPACSTPSGWTLLKSQAGGSSLVTEVVYYKIAQGGDTATITTDASKNASHIVLRIQNGGIPLASSTSGASGSANPPSLTPNMGTPNYLWLASCALNSSGTPTDITSGVSSYFSWFNQFTLGSAGAYVSVAERFLTTTTEDPGTFGSTSIQWAAITVAVPYSTPGGSFLFNMF